MRARSARSWAQLFGLITLLAAGFLAALLSQPTSADGLLRVRILDVGQGDAILIDAPTGEHLLVDGGPDSEVVSALSHFLAPPKRFAVVVASHNDADHIAGLPSVLSRYSVEAVWLSGAVHTTGVYEEWLRAVGRSGAKAEVVRAGYVRNFGDLEVRVLHPFRDFARIRPEEQHDATVVVKLTYGATSILLTGDLDEAQEAALLRHDRAALGATALKVSHHGSKNGTTPAFLEAVHPEIAVISVGRENRYGHPSPEIIDRLRATGVAVRRTDEHGTVTLTSDGIAVRVDVEQD